MTRLSDRTIRRARPSANPRLIETSAPTQPALLGIGTAVPELRVPQSEFAARMASLWGLSFGSLKKWNRIVEGAGIEWRHGVVEPEQVIDLTTAQRMLLYEQYSPELAARACAQAMSSAGVEAHRITDLIVVSCTGFWAPGLDVELVRRLGLGAGVRRSIIGFMGCFGGIIGLRAAMGACAAAAPPPHAQALALVVCVELCSLHVRRDADAQNQVASALFADGAAAVVVASRQRVEGETAARLSEPGVLPARRAGLPAALRHGISMLIEEGRDWMTWRITDRGFAMTLTRDVPQALRDCLADFVRRACVGISNAPPRKAGPHAGRAFSTFIIHPGGPGILDAADEALCLDGGCGLEVSREVLRQFGNMSSATVLFVLQEAIRRGHALPALLLAFGPGLSIESVVLDDFVRG